MEVYELPPPPVMRHLGSNARERVQKVRDVLSVGIDRRACKAELGLPFRGHAETQVHSAEEPVVHQPRKVQLALAVVEPQPVDRDRSIQGRHGVHVALRT